MFWFESKKHPDIWPAQLYDLEEDPEEQNNIIKEHPEVAEELELELRRFVDSLQEKESRNE